MNKPKWLELLYLGFILNAAVVLPAAAIAAYLSWSRWSFMGIFAASTLLIVAVWIAGAVSQGSRRR
jgi:hypothetical protein